MSRQKDGPTDRILTLARSAPGGVIRWCEAERCYLAASSSARREHRNALALRGHGRERRHAALHYHSSINKVLKRHFEKVEGTVGYYVLRDSIFNDDWAEDHELLIEFRREHGCDEFGRSTSKSVMRRLFAQRMSEITSDAGGAP